MDRAPGRGVAIREIEPLEAEDWDRLVADLEMGQTETQRKVMEEAREMYGSAERGCRTCRRILRRWISCA